MINKRLFTPRVITGIIGSFFLATLFAIVPMPAWLEWCRPAWLLMVLICWMLLLPCNFGLGTAWLIGIFADLLYGTVLGSHACVFLLIAYFVLQFHVRINSFPLTQKTLIVFVLLCLHQFLLYWFYAELSDFSNVWFYWLSLLAGAVIWPFLYMTLHKIAILHPAY